MTWDDTSISALQQAVSKFDRPQAAQLCDALVEHVQSLNAPFDADAGRRVLSTLRSKRYFDLMLAVADALIASGQTAAIVRRQYAQALIEHGHLVAALNILDDIVNDPGTSPVELAEARGLRGRVHKQTYIAIAGASKVQAEAALSRALIEYHEVYISDREEHTWHGINAVALLARAQRDRVAVAGSYSDPRDLAREVLATVVAKEEPDMWHFGTAAEACIALGQTGDALGWLGRYLGGQYCDAFELASTLRQLTEVWQLDAGSDPGQSILPILQGALLGRQGGAIDLTKTDIVNAGTPLEKPFEHGDLEAILGHQAFQEFEWYKMGLERCRAVAKIQTQFGRPIGTGFLIRGSDLHASLGDQELLLTNAHVVSDAPMIRGCLLPEEAIVTFEGMTDGTTLPRKYSIAELIWTSPVRELDVTLLRLDQPVEGLTPYPLARALPTLPAGEQDRVYIIGYPGGAGLSLSLYDNLLLDHDDPRVHYRAPTDHGSSGSPVFNRDWSLLALHHAGGQEMPKLHGETGVYPANEGIWIRAIIAALTAKLGP